MLYKSGMNFPEMICRAAVLTTLAWLCSCGIAQASDFAAPPTSPEGAGGLPTETVIDDFNNDGDPDTATSNANGDSVTVLLGDGNGDFTQAPTSPETVLHIPNSITSADFDKDGNPDLAVVAAGTLADGEEVTVLMGDGTGNFTAKPVITTGGTPLDIVTGDFNGDNNPDLATADKDASSITILLGNGTGGFTKPATSPEPAGGRTYALATGDFNGDNKTDIASANDSPDGVAILLGAGTGNFTAAATSPEIGSGRPIAVEAGDFNGDSKTDLAVAVPDTGIDILLGAGTGNFTLTATSPEATTPSAGDVVAADFDGDGKLDLATANFEYDMDVLPGSSTILMGAGDGNFTEATTSPERASEGTTAVATDDLDGDGYPDLVMTNYWGANLTILLNLRDELPVAVNDAKTVTEDDSATTIDVLANDTDVDAGPKLVASKTDGTHGTVAITNSGADLTYTPAADYCGSDSFTYKLNGNSTATVNVTVTCVDDDPIANDDSKTVAEDGPAVTIDVLANDTDVDAGPKTIASKTDGPTARSRSRTPAVASPTCQPPTSAATTPSPTRSTAARAPTSTSPSPAPMMPRSRWAIRRRSSRTPRRPRSTSSPTTPTSTPARSPSLRSRMALTARSPSRTRVLTSPTRPPSTTAAPTRSPTRSTAARRQRSTSP